MTRSTFRTAAVAGALLIGLTASGCASHKFVREVSAEGDAMVNARVDQTNAELTQVGGTAGEALARANAAHKLAEGKFLYQVVLSDDSVKFPTDVDALSPEAESRIAELAQRLKAENKNVYLEIQGHTDSVGDEDYNVQLGDARAEAVRRALSRQGIALNRMSTISYGEDSPLADNTTPDGRAQNRRVEIIVLT